MVSTACGRQLTSSITHGIVALFHDKRSHRERIYSTYQLQELAHERDKVEHFLASVVIVIFVYAVMWRRHAGLRLVAGTLVAAFLGCMKEAGDSLSLWPWCPPCAADAEDLIADGLGVLAAVILLLSWNLCAVALRRSTGYRTLRSPPDGELAEV
mgnify:CR=1 FL=1